MAAQPQQLCLYHNKKQYTCIIAKHALEQHGKVLAAALLFAGRAGRKPGGCRGSRGSRGEGQSGESISLAVVSADLPAKSAGLRRR